MNRELIKEKIQEMLPQLCSMSDQIFDYAEPGAVEYRSSKLLTDYLEAHGFAVEYGVGSMDTAFRAVYENGKGGPVVGFLAEYDALEGIGHACGHHMQGPSVIGAAMAIKELCTEKPYQLVIYGTPAEETFGGKIRMKEHGCFQELDVALMMHAAPNTCVDVKCMALESYTVVFHGKTSHAAISPEEGRSAFDAALLSFQGIEFLREHVRDDTRIHYTVLNAGGPSNIVPGEASAEYSLRSYNTDYLETVAERFKDIIRGAALMTGTTFDLTRDYQFQGKIPCHSINRLIMEQADYYQAPQIAPPREKTGSTDFGNVMYDVPGSCIRVAFVPEGTSAHSAEFLSAGKSKKAHEAIGYGAEILAATAMTLIIEPEKLAEIKIEFAENKEKMKK